MFDRVLNTSPLVMTVYGWFSLINEKRYMFFKSIFYLLSSRIKQRTTRQPATTSTTTTSTRTTSTTIAPMTTTTTTTSTTITTTPTKPRPAGPKLRKKKDRPCPRSQITATYYTHTLSFLQKLLKPERCNSWGKKVVLCAAFFPATTICLKRKEYHSSI